MELSVLHGNAQLILATENRHPSSPIWNEIHYDGPDDQTPTPECGIHSNPVFGLDWSSPRFQRTFNSALGTWWTLTVPFWFSACLATIPVVCRRARAVRRGHGLQSPLATRKHNNPGPIARAGLVVCVLVLIVWYSSGRFWIEYNTGNRVRVGINRGVIRISSIPECVLFLHQAGWEHGRNSSFELEWCLPHTADCAQSTIGVWWEINIPLWFVLALVATPVVFGAVRRRRIPPGHCQKCGYNLTGNVSGCCSECGLRFRRSPVGPGSVNVPSQGDR